MNGFGSVLGSQWCLSLAAEMSISMHRPEGRNATRVARLTVPVLTGVSSEAKASTARMRAISCIKALVSRALASLERSCDNFARRHGWVDMWTLEAAMPGVLWDGVGQGSGVWLKRYHDPGVYKTNTDLL
ncbi:hypothetical protein XPA_010745 [Xanthoria parietina]